MPEPSKRIGRGATVAEAPIRIAYVVHGLQAGGIERSVTRLVNALDRRRFLPMIICLHQSGPAANWIEARDVRIVELHKSRGNDWKTIYRLSRVLQENQCDIVQSHNWGTLVETVLARRGHMPVQIHAERGTVLGSVDHKGFRHQLRSFAMRWAIKQVDAVVSNATEVARRVEKCCGFPADQIHRIPNGVDPPASESLLTERDNIRRQLGIDSASVVVGSVGRLHEVKGFELAVAAVGQLVEQGHNIHLILVGDGPERDRLCQQAIERGVASRVHLVGHSDDVWPWLSAMDVFVNTSHSEGLSQSLVEGLAAGLPLIATNVGDNAILVGTDEKAAGLIVPRGDVRQLAEAIGKLSRDRRLRLRYHHCARLNHSNHYTNARMVKQFESLYQQVFTNARTNRKAVKRGIHPVREIIPPREPATR